MDRARGLVWAVLVALGVTFAGPGATAVQPTTVLLRVVDGPSTPIVAERLTRDCAWSTP